MRRDVFLAAGGFNAERYPTPCIEDIELGYRISDSGGAIVLDPAIQGSHLKRWTLRSMLTTDWRDRGVPWTRLLLERGRRARGSLAVGGVEPLKVALAALGITSGMVWLVPGGHRAVAGTVAAITLAGFIATNVPLLFWFAQRRGPWFALASIPLVGLFYGVAAAAGLGGLVAFAAAGFKARPAAKAWPT